MSSGTLTNRPCCFFIEGFPCRVGPGAGRSVWAAAVVAAVWGVGCGDRSAGLAGGTGERCVGGADGSQAAAGAGAAGSAPRSGGAGVRAGRGVVGALPPRSARTTLQTYVLQLRELIGTALAAPGPRLPDGTADAGAGADADDGDGAGAGAGGGGADGGDGGRLGAKDVLATVAGVTCCGRGRHGRPPGVRAAGGDRVPGDGRRGLRGRGAPAGWPARCACGTGRLSGVQAKQPDRDGDAQAGGGAAVRAGPAHRRRPAPGPPP